MRVSLEGAISFFNLILIRSLLSTKLLIWDTQKRPICNGSQNTYVLYVYLPLGRDLLKKRHNSCRRDWKSVDTKMTCVTCWAVPSIQAYQKTVSLTHIYQSKISTLIIHKILILLYILPLRFVERNYRFFRSLLLSCREGCTCERYGCYVMRTACKCQHPFSIIMWPSLLVTHRSIDV